MGDNGVGKISIIKKFEGKRKDKNEKYTEEITNFIIKYKDIKLKIYDINNEKNKSKEILDIIINCKIFFLVNNIRDKISFDNIGFWIENIKIYKNEKESYLFVIIGNKNDEKSKKKRRRRKNNK